MLEHIQSETLDKFQKALNDALSGGQGFSVAACDCKTSYMRLFDEQCKGIVCRCRFLEQPLFRIDILESICN